MMIAGGRDCEGKLLSDVWILKCLGDDDLQIIDKREEEKEMIGKGDGERCEQMRDVKSNANLNSNSRTEKEKEKEKGREIEVKDLCHDNKFVSRQCNDSYSNNDSSGASSCDKCVTGDIVDPRSNSKVASDRTSADSIVENIGEGADRTGTVLIRELILTADDQIWQKKDVENSGDAGATKSVSTARTLDIGDKVRNQDTGRVGGLVWERVVGLDLPTARCAHTSAISGRVIFIYGGFTGEGGISDVLLGCTLPSSLTQLKSSSIQLPTVTSSSSSSSSSSSAAVATSRSVPVTSSSSSSCDSASSLGTPPSLPYSDTQSLAEISAKFGNFELIEEINCLPVSQRIGWSTITLRKKSVKKEIKGVSKLLEKTDLGGRFGHAMCSLSSEVVAKIDSSVSSTTSNARRHSNPEDNFSGLLIFGGVNEEKDFDDVWLIEKISHE